MKRKEKVTAYDRVKLARDAKRPHIFDFIKALCSDFEELHGDRLVNDDQGLVGGFATIGGVKTLVLGWNFAYPKADRWVNWQTDSGLRESCDYSVAMEHIANKYPPVPEGRVGLFLR